MNGGISVAQIDPAQEAKDAATGRPMGWVATAGLAARAIVYLLMGWLVLLVATGDNAEVDQRGVLIEVARHPMGSAVVIALAVGFMAYALWRLSEVFFGLVGEPDGVLGRGSSLVRAVSYAVLASVAISVWTGARGSQSEQQEQMAAGLMATTWGRIAVGLAGAVFVGIGAYMAYEGVTRAFMRSFPSLSGHRRRLVSWLGMVGSTARGVVFAVTGALVVVAAWQVDPEKAGGLDDGVRYLLGLPLGHVLVGAVGVGLVVFGIYGIAESAWRRVPDERDKDSRGR